MDLNILIMVVAVLVTLSMSAILYVALAPRMQERARIRRRMALVSGGAVGGTGGLFGQRAPTASRDKNPEQGRRRNIQTRLKEAEEQRAKTESRVARYRRDLRQAGLNMSLQQFFLLCGGVGIVSAVVYLLMGYPALGAVPVGITVGFGLPRFVVRFLGKRRLKMFNLRFADAVDVIVRGIKSGLPIGECLNIIARESPEPVNLVFREFVEAQRMGLGLEEAMERALELMPTAELKFFGIVMAIQQQTGGNLAETLSNLSNILRSRKRMQDKVKALSSEARSSAMIIGSLPFLITGVLYLVSPEYIELLFTERLGQYMILGGMCWMSIGIFIMKSMVDFEI
ncbi:MAG: type II secretion system F family protein [Alphaproteobacteria bacterium]